MVQITFRRHDGLRRTIEAPIGVTLMEAAVFNGVEGMYASCGGDGGCATCHVYIDHAWLGRLAERSRKETNTLRFALNPSPASRLACQIAVEPDLDGLTVCMPERQF